MADGVLFVHNNFPAQFRDLAHTLLARGVTCRAISERSARGIPEVRTASYALPRGTTQGIYSLAVRAEADLLRGASALRAGRMLAAEGFEPQVIVAHPGWGETVFLDELYPDARQVHFGEFFYHGRGADIGFDLEFKAPDEEAILLGKAKNAVLALSYTDADAIVCPTQFQASLLPADFQPKVRVFHEGVDVEAIRPGPPEPFPLPDGRTIAPGAPVITHINNNLEPLRGLHIFLRALPHVLREVPDAQVLIIGEEGPRPYGGQPPEGGGWKAACLARVGEPLDMSRVHFLGRVPHARMLAALRLSTAHVYYTYPFVLSWSLVEAMASGCYVIGSDTGPLHDAIEDGVNGRLLPFFDVPALSEALIAACRDPAATAAMREAARVTAVERFDSRKGREGWLDLLREQGLKIP